MKITNIIEETKSISSNIKNSYIDFSKMTISVVAVCSDIIKNGKNYTQEDFMIGLARIYPSSCTFSTNRNGLKKITAGKLIKSLEKQKLERQNEILIQKKKEKAEIMKRKKRNYHAGKKK